MKKEEEYLTTAPKSEKITIENGSNFPNLKHVSGNSVNEHKELEHANINTVTGDEIQQQNENL